MNKDLPQPKQSEEVDLGQLFKMIGNAFDRLFKFIGSIFVGVYKIILLFFAHIYKRFYWYAGAVLIGFVVGLVLDMNSDKIYGANMFIETNFKSARQVYENVKQFHQLANVDKDTLELAERLNISAKEASKLKGFYIEPDIDENVIAEMYSEFYKRLDSISRLEMNYDRYKASLNAYNFDIHQIGVASTDKFIYPKIEKAFANGLSENEYLEDLLNVDTNNLDKEGKTLKEQVDKTDSLVVEYLKIRINESTKEPIQGSGTNLYMGNAESNNLIVDESKIIDKRLELEKQRRAVNKAKVERQNVVNVLAGFPKSGYDIGEWYDKKKLFLPIFLFSMTLTLFIFIGLGKFLKNYKTD